MARSITLSEEAFRALREEKRPGESDSDVILRLRRDARRKEKDPKAFLGVVHHPITTWDDVEAWLAESRRASARDLWRQGG